MITHVVLKERTQGVIIQDSVSIEYNSILRGATANFCFSCALRMTSAVMIEAVYRVCRCCNE